MSDIQYTAVGYTGKTHGLKGEMKAGIEDCFLEDFLKAEVVFLEVKGKKLPFFISSVRGKGDLIVKFEDVNVIEDAQPFTNKEVFLRSKDILADEDREIPIETLGYAYCEGFMMIDNTLGDLGVIEEVIEMPQSEMAVLQIKGNEVLIPLVPQFIVTIERDKKTVTVDLPEGLVEL